MNFYEVRFAPGSSHEKVLEKLEAGRTCCAMIVGYDIFIHHCHSHYTLMAALGKQWEDCQDGNFNYYTSDGVKSLIVRWKSGVDYRVMPQVNSAMRVHFGFEVGDLTIPPPLPPEETPF